MREREVENEGTDRRKGQSKNKSSKVYGGQQRSTIFPCTLSMKHHTISLENAVTMAARDITRTLNECGHAAVVSMQFRFAPPEGSASLRP